MADINIIGRLLPDSGKIHQNQEVYLATADNIIGVIKATAYKDPPRILIEVKANE